MLSLECELEIDWVQAETALAEAGMNAVRDGNADDFLYQILRAMDKGAVRVFVNTLEKFSQAEKTAMLTQLLANHSTEVNLYAADLLRQAGVGNEILAENLGIRTGSPGKLRLMIGHLEVHLADLMRRSEFKEAIGLPEWTGRLLAGIGGAVEKQMLSILENRMVQERLMRLANEQLLENHTGIILDSIHFSDIYPQMDAPDPQLWNAMKKSLAQAVASTVLGEGSV